MISHGIFQPGSASVWPISVQVQVPQQPWSFWSISWRQLDTIPLRSITWTARETTASLPNKYEQVREYYMGVSENSVPLNPMVLLIIIPIKWLFHWEYTQHFQTNPYTSNLQLSHPAFLCGSFCTVRTVLSHPAHAAPGSGSMATNDHHLKQRTNAANILQKPAVVQPDQQMHRKELKTH